VSEQRRLVELTELGVSIWLDDLDRRRLESGNLADLIRDWSVRGVTTNPAIFENALRNAADSYANGLRSCRAQGMNAEQAVQTLTREDVQAACDLFRGMWASSSGVDGRVSLEVDPRLAHDVSGTVDQACQIWRDLDRPNAMIKIPATAAGLEAIPQVLAQGISVNVTLIFSPDRYRSVLAAHASGLGMAREAGIDLSTIRSVASVFVSRVDTAVDARLDAVGSERAAALRGRAAVANAQIVWSRYVEWLAGDEWAQLAAAGAHPQRPLWASTGVKDPALPDTWYVTELIGRGCVNTMPEATLRAVADHGRLGPDRLGDPRALAQAQDIWQQVSALGIDPDDVFAELERAGVDAFVKAWERLLETTDSALQGIDARP